MAVWVTDATAGFTVDGDVVNHELQNFRESKLYNAMWQEGDGVSSGKHYWKIHFPTLEGDAAVGFTSKDYFKPSYECKCIGYIGGDLFNGGRQDHLVPGFGPKLKEGDVVGIQAVFEDDHLKMYIEINGFSLGLAFDVPASTFKSIFPMISFHNSGSATCTKQEEILDITERGTAIFYGIEGNWKLTHLKEDGVEVEILRRTSTKIIKLAEDKYSWHVKVARTSRTTLKRVCGIWTVCGIISDKVVGDDECIELEGVMMRLMPNLKKFTIDDTGKLGLDSTTITTKWERYDATPKPFFGVPFA